MTHNSGVAMCHSSARGPFYDEITNHPLGGRDRGAAWWTYARLARGSALALDASGRPSARGYARRRCGPTRPIAHRRAAARPRTPGQPRRRPTGSDAKADRADRTNGGPRNSTSSGEMACPPRVVGYREKDPRVIRSRGVAGVRADDVAWWWLLTRAEPALSAERAPRHRRDALTKR